MVFEIDPVPLLFVLFLGVSFAYSSIGLGGASTYSALMVIVGLDHILIPLLSLTLNLVVSTISGFIFLRRGHARFRLIFPFLVTSVPMAYLGGTLALSKGVFQLLLLGTLSLVAIRLYWPKQVSRMLSLNREQQWGVSLLLGSVLGFVAGSVGIGGGIYLVPLILVLGLGTEKQAAASGAFFVWVNSLSGLLARLPTGLSIVIDWFPLLLAVLGGGFLGAHLGATKWSPRTMQKVLGLIVLVAIVLLAYKVMSASG